MKFGLITYLKKPLIIDHSGVPRGTRCLKFVWSLLQLACFVYARSESPGKVMRTCRLFGAFATRQCNKNHHLVCWPIYSIIFSLRAIILFSYPVLREYLKFRNIVRAHISKLVSLLVTKLIQDASKLLQVYTCILDSKRNAYFQYLFHTRNPCQILALMIWTCLILLMRLFQTILFVITQLIFFFLLINAKKRKFSTVHWKTQDLNLISLHVTRTHCNR